MKDNWDIISCWYEWQLRHISMVWKTIETTLLVVGMNDNWDQISIETTFLLVAMKDNWDHIISCWYERQLRPHFYLLPWKTIETTLFVVGMKDNWDHVSTCWYERQLRPHY